MPVRMPIWQRRKPRSPCSLWQGSKPRPQKWLAAARQILGRNPVRLEKSRDTGEFQRIRPTEALESLNGKHLNIGRGGGPSARSRQSTAERFKLQALAARIIIEVTLQDSKAHANVFLIGLMGAGKTTVGRAVARRLNRPFFDSDHEIVARTGVHIPIIFEVEGEDGFRARESSVIDELSQLSGIVLATGGGAVLRPENRERLKSRGLVIYLRANPHELWLRTRRDKNRPLLQTEDPRARLEALYHARDPLYRECAHAVVDTGRPSINNLVNTVLMHLERAAIDSDCAS